VSGSRKDVIMSSGNLTDCGRLQSPTQSARSPTRSVLSHLRLRWPGLYSIPRSCRRSPPHPTLLQLEDKSWRPRHRSMQGTARKTRSDAPVFPHFFLVRPTVQNLIFGGLTIDAASRSQASTGEDTSRHVYTSEARHSDFNLTILNRQSIAKTHAPPDRGYNYGGYNYEGGVGDQGVPAT
jgi:hypothetical protein